MASSIVELEVSGRRVEVMVRPLTTLQSVLRELGFTSVKEGCRQGGCGSCTVLLDGEPVPSCLLPVEDAAGHRITTVEGLTPDDGLSRVQRAFLEGNGFQCGYCTPGMVMVATALLEREPAPSRERIVEALGGSICRCTGYEPIVDAIAAAAGAREGSAGRAEPRRPLEPEATR
ncbi:MAG TPA: (2Fe-2S)-binding protein [Candidatus Dormibacteraeota bacterium]|nr:(2Fe-2S)-binding protein [Candidatus Dormibacteraeota bacterium]